MNDSKKPEVSRLFRVTFLLFSAMLGVGLYGLIGAPIKQIGVPKAIENIENKTLSATAFISNIKIKDGKTNNEINVTLENPKNDFYTLKSTVINSKIEEGEKKIIILQKDGVQYDIPKFLSYVSDNKIDESLISTMQGSRYYISYKDKEYNGNIVIPVTNNEIAFAKIIGFESNFIDITLPLVRPLLSNNDIEMYKELKIVTRQIDGIDTRVIIGANDAILYAWSVYKNNIIISSNKEDYLKILSAI